jgi:calpain-15
MSHAPKDLQRQYIKQDKDMIVHNQKLSEKFVKFPFSLMPLEQIQSLLSRKIDKFFDLEFAAHWRSIYDSQQNALDVYIHWRRPEAFIENPVLFKETLETDDLKPGILGNEWFLSAVAMLCERPALIEKLFVTKTVTSEGLYRVKICKHGVWSEVTIDDLIPCYPQGMPLFTQGSGSEIWPMLLEKAYAKLHGNYY